MLGEGKADLLRQLLLRQLVGVLVLVVFRVRVVALVMDQHQAPAPTAPDVGAGSELALWERALAVCKGLNSSQMAICKAFALNPRARSADLATVAGCSERTVQEWRRRPEFWRVVRALGFAQTHADKVDALIEAQLDEMQERAGKLDQDDLAWLKVVAAKTGQLREAPQAVAVAMSGGVGAELSARISARAAELAAGIQAELGLDSQVERVADVTSSTGNRVEHSQQGAAGGSAGGAA